MLADTVDIENADGAHNYSLNADSGGVNPFSPLDGFDVTIVDRGDATRYKQQQAGAWPTRSYEGEMAMNVKGNLFGDTQPDYWTARQNLLLACRGVPGANITAYKRGTLFVTPEGATERWFADFGPFTFSAPLEGNLVGGTPILLTLTSWTPWFFGEDTGNLYWWS
jgi:hypothetical protein